MWSQCFKIKKYNQTCTGHNVDFLPLVNEIFGKPSKTTNKDSKIAA
jgi:hypothetical protein